MESSTADTMDSTGEGMSHGVVCVLGRSTVCQESASTQGSGSAVHQFDGNDWRDQLGRIAGKVSRGLEQLSEKRPNLFVLRQILPGVRLRECLKLAKTVQQIDRIGSRPGGGQKAFERFVGLIWHPEEDKEDPFEEIGHLHIYHSCTFNQSHCTCAFLRGLKLKRLRPRFATPISEAKRADWGAWFEYFSAERRQFLHVQIGGISLSRDVHQYLNLRAAACNKEDQANGALEIDGVSSESAW